MFLLRKATKDTEIHHRSVELGKWILDRGEISAVRFKRLEEFRICFSKECSITIGPCTWNSSENSDTSNDEKFSVLSISRLWNRIKNISSMCNANKQEANTHTADMACRLWQSMPNLWDILWISWWASVGFIFVQCEYSPQKTAYWKVIILRTEVIPMLMP